MPSSGHPCKGGCDFGNYSVKRIKVDLSEFFEDERKISYIFYNPTWKHIKCIKYHLKKLFPLPEISLLSEEQVYLPPEESVEVINPGESIKIITEGLEKKVKSKAKGTFKQKKISKPSLITTAITEVSSECDSSSDYELFDNSNNNNEEEAEKGQKPKRKRRRKRRSNRTTLQGNEQQEEHNKIGSKENKISNEVSVMLPVQKRPISKQLIGPIHIKFDEVDGDTSMCQRNEKIPVVIFKNYLEDESIMDIARVIPITECQSGNYECNSKMMKNNDKEVTENGLSLINEETALTKILTTGDYVLDNLFSDKVVFKTSIILPMSEPLNRRPAIEEIILFKVQLSNSLINSHTYLSGYICGKINDYSNEIYKIFIIDGFDQLRDKKGNWFIDKVNDEEPDHLFLFYENLFDLRIINL